MKQIIKKIILLHFLGLILSSCSSFEKNIDIPLPETERQLVIECYLRPNQPFRVLLTETKGYFDSLNECPTVKNAIVVIEYNNRRDTLQEANYLGECSFINPNFIPFMDSTRTRFYNYGSASICPYDLESEFRIHVYDSIGNRSAHASTKLVPTVAIDSISTIWNEARLNFHAYITATDNLNERNYYRMQVHKNSLFDEQGNIMGILNVFRGSVYTNTFSDEIFNGNSHMSFKTNDAYNIGDTIIASLYHITAHHYEYLYSTSRAESANGNPFAQPPTLVTNIQGGLGIFTGLSYTRDTLVIQ